MAEIEYPKDTLGYHRAFALAIFGAESSAVKWLDDKTKESPNGLSERVIHEESQVVFLLGQIHLRGIKQGDL